MKNVIQSVLNFSFWGQRNTKRNVQYSYFNTLLDTTGVFEIQVQMMKCAMFGSNIKLQDEIGISKTVIEVRFSWNLISLDMLLWPLMSFFVLSTTCRCWSSESTEVHWIYGYMVLMWPINSGYLLPIGPGSKTLANLRSHAFATWPYPHCQGSVMLWPSFCTGPVHTV